MALTKKAQAALQVAQAEVQVLRDRAETMLALRWRETAPVLPDVPPPEGSSAHYTTGWSFNAYNQTVSQAWSSGNSHGDGVITFPQGSRRLVASEGSCALYSTKRRALRALCYEVGWQAAQALRAIDVALEAEEAPLCLA
jgi:hypothetical protein